MSEGSVERLILALDKNTAALAAWSPNATAGATVSAAPAQPSSPTAGAEEPGKKRGRPAKGTTSEAPAPAPQPDPEPATSDDDGLGGVEAAPAKTPTYADVQAAIFSVRDGISREAAKGVLKHFGKTGVGDFEKELALYAKVIAHCESLVNAK